MLIDVDPGSNVQQVLHWFICDLREIHSDLFEPFIDPGRFLKGYTLERSWVASNPLPGHNFLSGSAVFCIFIRVKQFCILVPPEIMAFQCISFYR